MRVSDHQMSSASLRHGDFSKLAEDYSRYRSGYSESVVKALLGLQAKPAAALDAVDVGAGTGIWTRMLAGCGLRSVTAVEPNSSMRELGIRDSQATGIRWIEGAGEATGLVESCCDLVTMASSFHWVDFAAGTAEFHRILRPGGRFVALWNPRYIDENPQLIEIENHLKTLKPDISRVSSGRSGLVDRLDRMLSQSPHFRDVVYVEGKHAIQVTLDHYLGAWRSVNDLQVQLGDKLFGEFLDFIRSVLRGRETIEIIYLTRAWSAARA